MGIPTSPATELQDYAIIVGISYPDASLKNLLGARRDASAFARWLRSPRGGNVLDDNVRTVSSPSAQGGRSSAKPLQDHIDRELESLGVGGSKKPIGRRLYFYFSGHGIGLESNEVCVLMAGASVGKYNHNISLSGYRELFQKAFYFEEVIFILDCCRDPKPPVIGFDPRWPHLTPEEDSPAPSVCELVLLAAANGLKAHEVRDPKTSQVRGLFTLALLESLRDHVGVDGNGQHTAATIQANLEARVKALAIAAGREDAIQHPKVIPGSACGKTLALASFSKITKVPVRIVAPTGATGRLTVFKGTTTEVDHIPAADATIDKKPWRVKLLPTELYSVRLEPDSGDAVDAVINWAALGVTRKDGTYVFLFPDS